MGFDVKTMDIDKKKNPDIVANIAEYEFPDLYDYIPAFEIFEHIPFEEFRSVVCKLSGACRKNLFVGVPYNEKVLLHLELYVPGVGKKLFI